MNAPEPPLSPETLDELLSADLDGEFARAATDLGFTVDEARAALHASPDTTRRRAELTRAHTLLAAPVPAAPSVTARLVSTALDGADELRSVRARRARAGRVVVTVGSAAAVIAGVVVAFAVIDHHPAASSRVAAATSPLHQVASGAAPAGGQSRRFVDFGEVSRPATLRADVEMRLRTSGYAANAVRHARSADATPIPDIVAKLASLGWADRPGPVGLQGPQGLEGVQGLQGDFGIAGPTGPTGAHSAAGGAGITGAAGGTGVAGGIGPQGPSGDRVGANAPSRGLLARPPQPAASTSGADSALATTAEPGCATTIERRAHLRSAPVLSGFGTDAHRPVVIVVFSQPHRYVVYVLAASDCTVVSQQTLP